MRSVDAQAKRVRGAIPTPISDCCSYTLDGRCFRRMAGECGVLDRNRLVRGHPAHVHHSFPVGNTPRPRSELTETTQPWPDNWLIGDLRL